MYPVVTLARIYKPRYTAGSLRLPSGDRLKTLELPWKGNQQNVSCIPPGVYLAKWLERSASGRFRHCWIVQNVPNRSGILFHVANLVRQLLGCIAPGLKHGTLEGDFAVLSSGNGLNRMRAELSEQDFILVIR